MSGLQNVAMASGYQEVTLDDFKKVEPVYLMITGATRNCVIEHDCGLQNEMPMLLLPVMNIAHYKNCLIVIASYFKKQAIR